MVRTILSRPQSAKRRVPSYIPGMLIGIACLFLYTTVGADWTVLREDDIIRGDGINAMLQDVHFTNNQNGLVVGQGGLILVTNDGGKTWEKMEVDMSPPAARQRAGAPGTGGGPPPGFGRGGPADLYNIYFIDEKTGFITGGRGTILKTEDGGKTWARKMARSESSGQAANPRARGIRANLMGIQMLNAEVGFIAGSENTILKTTDGGETWVGSSERARVGETRNNLENIRFVSPTTGWIIGSFGTLLQTNDGGETWEKQDPGFDNNLFGIHFLDANIGWICGQEGLILHTIDGGKTWNQQATNSHDDLHDIIFVDGMVGWAVGAYNVVLHTTDGGKTWNPQKAGGGGSTFKGVSAIDKDHCWVVDDWGVIAGYTVQ